MVKHHCWVFASVLSRFRCQGEHSLRSPFMESGLGGEVRL